MAVAAKDLEISVLLDYYGAMLTEKQREVADWYYNKDLSLAEIAEHTGITRQGVRDAIKRAEIQLLEYEEKLGLRDRLEETQDKRDEIVEQAARIQEESQRLFGAESLWNRARRIGELAAEINI